MTEQEQLEFEALERMFESDGWQIFQRQHEERRVHFRDHGWEMVKTLDQFNYHRGVLATLEDLTNYESGVRAAKASHEVPDNE